MYAQEVAIPLDGVASGTRCHAELNGDASVPLFL